MIVLEGYELIYTKGTLTENEKKMFSLISRPEILRPTEIKSVEQETFLDDPLNIIGYEIKGKLNIRGHEATLWDRVDTKGNLLASSAMTRIDDMRYDVSYERNIDEEDYRYSIIDLSSKEPEEMLDSMVNKKLDLIFKRENKNISELSELNPRSKEIVDYKIPSNCNYGHDFSFFKIKGDLHGSGVNIKGRLNLMCTEIGGDLYLSKAKIDELTLEALKVKGNAFLDNFRFGRLLSILLDWDEMHIGGNTDFRNLKADSLSLNRSKFMGNVDFGGMNVKRLSLEDVFIESCKLDGLEVDYIKVNENTKIPENLIFYLEKIKSNPSYQEIHQEYAKMKKFFEKKFEE